MSYVVQIDLGKVIALNRLSLGTQVDDHGWRHFKDSPSRRAILKEINPGFVRIFQWKMPPSRGPCTSWNSSTHTGTFNWQETDQVVNGIIAIGAEPIICVGNAYTGWSRAPPGMVMNPATSAPYPDDWKEYMKAWVSHYKGKVKYWNSFNEGYHYYPWNASPSDPLYQAFRDLHIAAYEGAHEVDPNCLVSFDAIMIRNAFEDFINGNYDVDFLDFHSYGGSSVEQSDREILDIRSRMGYFGSGSFVGVEEARQRFIDHKGYDPDIFHGEANWSYVWTPSTDPRNVYMQGAVLAAMQIGWGMELGLTNRVHFVFADDSSSTPGHGFGMISDDTEYRRYPFLLYKMLGSQLGEGDPIYSISSNDPHVMPFAWRHGDTINILLVNKAGAPRSVDLSGVKGQVPYQKIVSDIPWNQAQILTGNLDLAQPIQMSEYEVLLLHTPISPLDMLIRAAVGAASAIALILTSL